MVIKGFVAFALCVFGVTPAIAGPVDAVRFGVLAQGWGGPGADREQGAALNAELLFNSPDVLSKLASPKPVVGVTAAFDSDATSQLYAGLEWSTNINRNFFVSGFVGGAVHNGATRFDPLVDGPRIGNTVFYGCRVLFRLSADIGYRLSKRTSLSAHVAHISNAGLCSVNEGLDHVGLRFGYDL